MINKQDTIGITGATGLVGAHLCRHLLSQGYKHVIGLRRESSNLALLGPMADKVDWIYGDVRDAETAQELADRCDAIVHTAAVVSFSPKDKKRMFDVNVEGTANLINHAIGSRASRFIHVSSVAALSRILSGQVIDESVDFIESKENSQYALSKYQAELEAWRGQAEGLSVAIVNPSIILGGGFWDSGSMSLVGTLAGGLPYYGTGGTGVVDVRDVVKGIERLLDSDVAGRRFILNGPNVTYRELFDGIAGAIGVEPPSKPLAAWKGELAWRAVKLWSRLSGKTPLITKETVRTSRFTSIYNSSRAQNELGIAFRSLEETMAAIAQTYERGKAYGLFPLD